MRIEIGSRWYELSEPLSEFEKHDPCWCIWSDMVVFMEYNWESGHFDYRTTYSHAKAVPINGNKDSFFHVFVGDLRKILDTNSKKIKVAICKQ